MIRPIRSHQVAQEFVEKLLYTGDHYDVSLPWKATHPPLPENYELSLQRLQGLLSRLREKPDILEEYDSVIKDQIERGIVSLSPSCRASCAVSA